MYRRSVRSSSSRMQSGEFSWVHLSGNKQMMIPSPFIKAYFSNAGDIWLLYSSIVLTTSIWLQPSLSMISYFGYAVIFVVCKLRRQAALNTICKSHLRNVQTVALVGFMVLNVVLVTIIGTLGLGAFIRLPLWVFLAGWSAYRVARGVIMLKQGRPF